MWSSTSRVFGAVLAALLAAVVLLGGCVTADSEIPWNAPQSWEGSPMLPGLSRGE